MMNLSEKLKNFLNDDFLTAIDKIGKNADNFGVSAYIIGGAVRDFILNKPIYDIDIVIEGNAIEFCRFMQNNEACKIIRAAQEFCTVKALFDNRLELDFASTRTEKYPKAGHLPVLDTIGCTLKEDILRRDFSVNSLALKINKSEFGKLVDYTNGLSDIQKKELRILHEKSFIDDPTRIIRGLRFCHKLGFKLEEKTQKLQNDYLNDFSNNDICYERIKQVIKLAFNLNIPELVDEFLNNNSYKLLDNNVRKINVNALYEAIKTNIMYIEKEDIWLIYFAAIVDKQTAEKFNLTAKEIRIVESLENLLSQTISLQNNFEIYNKFKNEPIESVIAYCSFDSENIAQKYLTKLKDIRPSLNGNDLLHLGLSAGKIIGEILNKILEEKLNNNLKTREEELSFVRKYFL